MAALIVGLRAGEHKELNQIAKRVGSTPKEVAGILLEQAIRRAKVSTAASASDDYLTTIPAGSPAVAQELAR